ncbi:MAG: hypothetical protein J6U01_00985 [Clostridia bacterium]|nr:hypothetical protein [Clostridia bacterium]
MIFDELVRQLKEINGVEFKEYEMKTRPAGNFGTVQLDFEADDDNGDDSKVDRAWQGSVDLFTHGKQMLIVAAVESALESVCEGSWYLNSEQYERETGLIHREFVFEIEAR